MYLSGSGWRRKRDLSEHSAETEQDQLVKPCAFIGIGNSDHEMQRLSLDEKVGVAHKVAASRCGP